MPTERFDRKQFEQVLQTFVIGHKPVHPINHDGLLKCEYHYSIWANGDVPHRVLIQVNSSIDASGYAADTGENSIRLWITDDNGNPLASKLQAYVTRVKGWEKRLTEQLEQVADMADLIQFCNKCHSMEHIFKVQKDGPNKGRLFIKCSCPNSFEWLDYEGDEPKTKSTAKPNQPVQGTLVEQTAPTCSKCGRKMVLRIRKSDSNKFWGCTGYPECHYSFDYDPYEAKRNNWGEYTQTPIQAPDKGTLSAQADILMKQAWANREREKEAAAMTFAEKRDAALEDLHQTTQQLVKDVAEFIKPKTFVDSKYQTAIFEWGDANLKNGSGKSLIVRAVAGSGKSTTGERLVRKIPAKYNALYMAFNVKVVADMKKRNLPSNVTVSTTNSAGFGAVVKAFHPQFDEHGDKMHTILNDILDKFTQRHLFAPVAKLVTLLRANLMQPSNDNMEWIIDHYALDVNGDRPIVYAAVQLAYERSVKMTNLVDFDDQIFMPVFYDLPCRQYDIVFLDELQDFTKCQAALAMKMVKPNGIIIGVGDEFQSLYVFRGADIDSMDNVQKLLEADELPLSISYRCPKVVGHMVNEEFPDLPFEVAEWNVEGTFAEMSPERASMEYKPGDLVLCRCNAPLVKPAFELIRRRIKAIILGREIGSGLITLIRKLGANNISDLIGKLRDYKERELPKLLEAGKTSSAETLNDKIETIIALTEGCDNLSQLEDNIEMVFSDKEEGVVFSSVHRAKGSEADRVFIIEPNLMPHPMAKQDWEKEQERHIKYVAITRTKNTLIFVQ